MMKINLTLFRSHKRNYYKPLLKYFHYLLQLKINRKFYLWRRIKKFSLIMSGHSKWASIKHSKGKADKQRSKILYS